ncbi:hypothetical protein BJF84_16075 [Rhodococcus sp. CUA-806]|nr:hypothetical protein BJF84_16075 [Rhodococcus sp. CUA-806]
MGCGRVGSEDDFFALGGNSLIATRVVSRLSSALDARVTVRSLFDAPTVAGLAALLGASVGEGSTGKLSARPRPAVVPLSFAQQRMWVLNRIDPTSTSYNVSLALRLSGQLDTDALAEAITDVLARHETLRTRYPEVGGTGSQQVMSVTDVEWDTTPVPVRDRDVAEQVRTLLGTSFDVSTSVPVLVRILARSADEHILVLVVHHIAIDGFSLGPLTRDLMTAYAARSMGQEPGWAPLDVQYADFVLWQRDVLGESSDPASIMSAQESFWQRTLAEIRPQTGIATDRPRAASASGLGRTHEFTVDGAVVQALHETAREHNSTLFMALHTALAIVLSKLSGDEDIVVGTPVAGRGEAALDDIVGMFVNTLVLRTPVSQDVSASDVLQIARRVDLEAFASFGCAVRARRRVGGPAARPVEVSVLRCGFGAVRARRRVGGPAARPVEVSVLRCGFGASESRRRQPRSARPVDLRPRDAEFGGQVRPAVRLLGRSRFGPTATELLADLRHRPLRRGHRRRARRAVARSAGRARSHARCTRS